MIAKDADVAALTAAAEGAIAKLAPESQDFVTQIQAEKDAARPAGGAAAVADDHDRGVRSARGVGSRRPARTDAG